MNLNCYGRVKNKDIYRVLSSWGGYHHRNTCFDIKLYIPMPSDVISRIKAENRISIDFIQIEGKDVDVIQKKIKLLVGFEIEEVEVWSGINGPKW